MMAFGGRSSGNNSSLVKSDNRSKKEKKADLRNNTEQTVKKSGGKFVPVIGVLIAAMMAAVSAIAQGSTVKTDCEVENLMKNMSKFKQ